jgi:hypothetical protein
MKVPDTNKLISIAIIIGIFVALYIIYKILDKVGIIKTGADKREEAAEESAKSELLASDLFKPGEFHPQIGTYKSIGSTAAYSYADKIHQALRGVGTNEDLLFSVFLKLYNKVNISEIATAYALNYKSDMGLDLADDLSKSEMVRLMEIINKLPNK